MVTDCVVDQVFYLSIDRWANLRNAADIKKAKLDKALKLQQYHADVHETKVM